MQCQWLWPVWALLKYSPSEKQRERRNGEEKAAICEEKLPSWKRNAQRRNRKHGAAEKTAGTCGEMKTALSEKTWRRKRLQRQSLVWSWKQAGWNVWNDPGCVRRVNVSAGWRKWRRRKLQAENMLTGWRKRRKSLCSENRRERKRGKLLKKRGRKLEEGEEEEEIRRKPISENLELTSQLKLSEKARNSERRELNEKMIWKWLHGWKCYLKREISQRKWEEKHMRNQADYVEMACQPREEKWLEENACSNLRPQRSDSREKPDSERRSLTVLALCLEKRREEKWLEKPERKRPY